MDELNFVFAVSVLLSMLYSLTIKRVVTKFVSFGYNKLEHRIKKRVLTNKDD